MSEETKFECPNCHSDNIQSFEVAYRNGVTTSSSTTTGLGVGSGGGLGLGTADDGYECIADCTGGSTTGKKRNRQEIFADRYHPDVSFERDLGLGKQHAGFHWCAAGVGPFGSICL